MKGSNIFIGVLVLLVVGSGSYLGYSIYNLKMTPANNTDSQLEDIRPTCSDQDGDMFGENCDKGPDCDDNDKSRNQVCKELTDPLAFKFDKGSYKVGDKVKVDVELQNLPAGEHLEMLNFRVKYSPESLKLSGYQLQGVYNEGNSIEITLESEVALDIINTDGMKDGDKVATITFDAIAAGKAEVMPGDGMRIELIYAPATFTTKAEVEIK